MGDECCGEWGASSGKDVTVVAYRSASGGSLDPGCHAGQGLDQLLGSGGFELHAV